MGELELVLLTTGPLSINQLQERRNKLDVLGETTIRKVQSHKEKYTTVRRNRKQEYHFQLRTFGVSCARLTRLPVGGCHQVSVAKFSLSTPE